MLPFVCFANAHTHFNKIMAAAALDMHEVRKSQRRHAALLSGVYPFGHPMLVRTSVNVDDL